MNDFREEEVDLYEPRFVVDLILPIHFDALRGASAVLTGSSCCRVFAVGMPTEKPGKFASRAPESARCDDGRRQIETSVVIRGSAATRPGS